MKQIKLPRVMLVLAFLALFFESSAQLVSRETFERHRAKARSLVAAQSKTASSPPITITLNPFEIEPFELPYGNSSIQVKVYFNTEVMAAYRTECCPRVTEFDLELPDGYSITSMIPGDDLYVEDGYTPIIITGHFDETTHKLQFLGYGMSSPEEMALFPTGRIHYATLILQASDARSGNYSMVMRNAFFGMADNPSAFYIDGEKSFDFSVAQVATEIVLSQTTADLLVGNTLQLSATIYPSNVPDKSVTWETSNSSIATVSSNGLVTALLPGTVTITATTQDGSNLSASCQITVAQPVTGISLNKSEASIVVDNTLKLTATVTPIYATNKVVAWSSSNSNVATVSSGGLVTAKSVGTAIITATTTDGTNLSASCTVTVTPQLATGITISQTTASVVVDKTLQLSATITPSNTTNKTVTWTSSNTNVATVSSSGLVTANAVGMAVITATTTDGSNLSSACQVTVTPQLATGVSLNKTSASIVVDKTLQLTATVSPSNTTNPAVTWKSSNTSIATVSSTGLVTAKAVGTATITVTTADGSNKSATCQVTVTPQLASGVTLDKTSASIVVDKTLQLTATVSPSNTTNPAVTWKSSNTSIATVSSTGLVTAKAVGTATITVTTADGSNKSATCQVTVTPQLATGVTLDKTTASIVVDKTLQLTATVTPSNTTNKAVTWSSSNTSIATVNSNGLVTAKAVGTATITVTTADGSNKSATCQVTVTPQLATGITMSQTSASIVVDKTLQLSATITPSNTTNKTVTWTSSNTNVATVSSTGLVTAKALGTATITVTTTDGSNKSATCQVTVTPQLATGVSLNRTSASIVVDKTLQLTATVSPSNTTNPAVTWKSSNTSIATVSSTGLVTAKAVGTATITVTTADGSNKSATCQVTVTPQLASGVTLDKTSASIVVDKTLQLTATVSPSNTTNPAVTWKSSNTSIATVSSTGLVTAKAVGTATITVTTADGSNKSATCQVTVTPQLATGVTLDKTTASIVVDKTLQLTATVTPSNTTNKAVTWSSSNTSIATVNSNGLVTAKAVGTATITVTTADGSNKSATCQVTVTPQFATGITLDKISASLVVDKTLQLTATVSPSNTTNKAVTWSSSNNDVATVSGTGLVTAIAVGTATITVTTADGSNLSASCQIAVTPQLATSITLDQSEAEVGIGDKITLTATVLPSNVTNNSVRWRSDDNGIATVVRGVVTGVSEGECVITATTQDGTNLSAQCLVIVTKNSNPQGNNYMSSNDIDDIVSGHVLTIPVELTNEDEITGFQADLYIPSGFTPMYDDDDRFVYLETSRANGHTIGATVSAVATRIVASSQNNTSFKGNSGNLFYVKLKVRDNLVRGMYRIEFKNIYLTTSNAELITVPNVGINVGVESYHSGDVDGNDNIDVRDYQCAVNYILAREPSDFIYNAADMNGDGLVIINDLPLIIEEIKRYEFPASSQGSPQKAPSQVNAPNDKVYISNFDMAGNKTTSVNIKLRNSFAYSAVQCDITLPHGLSIVKQSDDSGNDIYAVLTGSRLDGHQISSSITPTGDVRVIITNAQNQAITGSSGTIARITLKSDKNFSGEHQIVFHNIVAAGSDDDAQRYTIPDAVVYVNQGANIPGDIDGNGEVNGTDLNILINIILGKDNADNYGGRANVDGQGDVNGSDLNALINIILGKG